MVKSILSLISLKWVKVGQKDNGAVNTYQICNYLKVGQVGQNHLTHFLDFNSLSGGDLMIVNQSGSRFPERDSEKKSIRIKFMRKYEKLSDEHRKICNEYIASESFRGIRKADNRIYLLKPFFEYLTEKNLDVKEITERDAQEFQTWLSTLEDNQGKLCFSSATVSAIMGTASSLSTFLSSSGRMFRNPFLQVKRIRLEHKLPRNLPTEDRMDKLLKVFSEFWKQKTVGDQRLYYKSHVMAELMYASGLRISEVLSLREEDIDFEGKTIHVKNGKGGRDRKAYLNEYSALVLRIYINRMMDVIRKKGSPEEIFGVRGQSTISSTFHRVLAREGKNVGLEEFPSHSFRHTLGFHLLRRGCDMRFIQLILGHQDMNSTTIYTKVEKSDLRDELDRYHPRGSFSRGL
ncbi:MAG: tyrosine-type recombinase/integrase [bacterium]|nr:tyrosine-type recombinase/integrase [bacterium]